jgi:uncharacterized protein (TIGR00251 family)
MENAKDLLLNHGFLAVKVTPKAPKDVVFGFKPDANGKPELQVKLRAAPEDGKANEALLRLLAAAFEIPVSTLDITRGLTSRQKMIAYTPK